MNEVDIAQRVVTEGRNVYAVIISRWHLIGALSYIYSLQKERERVSAIIAVLPHPTDGFLVEEAYLPLVETDIVHCTPGRMPKADVARGWARHFFHRVVGKWRNQRHLHFLSVMVPEARSLAALLAAGFDGHVGLVALDEGTGTYLPRSQWKQVRDGEAQERGSVKAVAADIAKDLLLLPFDAASEMFMFNNDGQQLVVNADVVSRYRLFFEELYWRLYPSGDRGITGEAAAANICLYISQPVVELGAMTQDDYGCFLRTLKSVCDSVRLLLVVKPHPRENRALFSDIGAPVVESDHVVEALVATLEPKCVIGISSTALVTVPIFFKVPAFSILKVFENSFSQMTPFYMNSLVYVQIFGDWMPAPATADALRTSLAGVQ